MYLRRTKSRSHDQTQVELKTNDCFYKYIFLVLCEVLEDFKAMAARDANALEEQLENAEMHNVHPKGQSSEASGGNAAAIDIYDEDSDEVSSPKNRPSPLQLKILTNGFRALPPFVALGCLVYIIYLLADSDNWSTDSDSSDAEQLAREKARGHVSH